MELLKRWWVIFRRRWLIVLACLAIATVGVSAYNATADKKFTASTELFLRAPDVKTSAGAYQGDLFSRQRAQTYVNMVHSDELAQMVIDKLGLTLTPQQLVSQVSATTVKDTVLMVVSVTDSNPQRAANIANGYGDVIGTYVAKIENVGNNPDIPPLVQVVTTANPGSAKASGYPLWFAASAAAGAALVLALAIVGFLEHFDTKVRSRRQVEDTTGSDIIGKLPKVRSIGRHGDVAQAFGKSKTFSQAALRLSVNVESVVRSLPKVDIPTVIAVVAGHDREGATVVARSLARALAERGRGVGLFDFNTRQASDQAGFVAAGSQLPDEGREANPVTVRSHANDASLTAEILERELDALRADSDFVLIDAPAFHESVDAQVIVGTADAVILVVRPNVTTIRSLSELTSGIALLDTPMLGVVANLAKQSSTVDGLYL